MSAQGDKEAKQLDLINIGDELLIGIRENGHLCYLGDMLARHGVDLRRDWVVRDKVEDIVRTFKVAWEESDIVLTTGGLGPTSDDMTREALAEALGLRLVHSEEVETALIEELRRNEFTTAQQAARLLGKRGSRRAVEPLRAALDSHDYLLQAKAAVALARLGDTESLDRVGEIIHTSTNPLVVIHAAAALRLYEDPRGLRRLLHGLTRREIDPYVADEIIIDAATILGIGSWFYRLYARFTRSPEEGRDEVAALLAEGNREIMDALVSAAKGELIEEGATQSGASRRSQARSLLIEEIRSLASEAPEPLARGMEGLAYEEVVYPGRLLILLLAAHSVENIPIE
ncbi:MAG: molybdopterin-binding protein [Alkalispirochaetaceae bacterium]